MTIENGQLKIIDAVHEARNFFLQQPHCSIFSVGGEGFGLTAINRERAYLVIVTDEELDIYKVEQRFMTRPATRREWYKGCYLFEWSRPIENGQFSIINVII